MAKKPVAPKLADVVNSPEYKGMSDSIKEQIENALLESKGKPPLPKTSKKAISAEEILANPAMVKAIKEKIGEEAVEDFIKKADEKSKIDDTDKPIVVDKQNKVRKTKQKTRKHQELEQQENTQRSLKDFILGKGSKAFNKMFPQLGALMGGVYRGGDRSANNNTTTQTNTSSNASGTTAILSSIVDSQRTSVDILQQILTAIKATPRTPSPTTGQNQTPPPASNQNQTPPPPASNQNQRSQSGQNQTPPPASRTTTAPAPRQGAQMNPATAAATVAGGAAIANAGGGKNGDGSGDGGDNGENGGAGGDATSKKSAPATMKNTTTNKTDVENITQQRNTLSNSSGIDYDRLFNLLFHGRLTTSANSTPATPTAPTTPTTTPATASAPPAAPAAIATPAPIAVNPEYSEEAAAGATRPYINPETPIYDRGEPTPEILNTENLISSYQEITNRYQSLMDLLNDQGDFAINILTMSARYTANRNFLGRVSTGNNTYDTSIIQRLIANLGNIESRRLELLDKVSIAFRNCLQFRAQLARLQSSNFMPSGINSRIESDNKQLETFVSDYNKLLSDFNSIEENNGREDATPVPSPIPDSQIYDRGEPAPERTISDLLKEHRENVEFQRRADIRRQINRGTAHYTAASNLENYSPEPMPPAATPATPATPAATPATPAAAPAAAPAATPAATPARKQRVMRRPPKGPDSSTATAGVIPIGVDGQLSPGIDRPNGLYSEDAAAATRNNSRFFAIKEEHRIEDLREYFNGLDDKFNGKDASDGSGDGGEEGGAGGDATPKSASQEAQEEDLRENRILNFKADEIFFKANKFEFEGDEENEQDASKTTSNNTAGGGGGGADATPAPNTAFTGGGGTGGDSGGSSSSSAAGGANPSTSSTSGNTAGGGADAAPAPTSASGDTGGEGINGATTGGASSTTTTGDAAQAPNPAATAGLNFAPGVDQRIKPGIADKVKDVQSGFGKGLSITSGYRDPARNARVGGATGSKHLTGDAVDVKFSGNQEDTINFIKAASAKGLGGIGVYGPGFVHIDTGPKRVWGPDYRAGSIPAWAKAALNDHMTGQTTATPTSSSPISGGELAQASAQNDMSTRVPTPTPSAQLSNSGSTNPVARSESSANPIDPNNPGPLEPADAGLRYARLFSMAA
jgi:hypothetical protein